MEARYQLRQSPVSVDELPVHNLTDLTVEALDGLLSDSPGLAAWGTRGAASDCRRRRLGNGYARGTVRILTVR